MSLDRESGFEDLVVREELLPYGRHMVDEEDIAAVLEVLSDDWITQGPRISQFEARLSAFVDADHAVAVNSGTAALHVALHAAGIGPGDEVITTPLTFAATANAVVHAGGRPVFADIRADTLNLDPNSVADAITDKTRAIIAVDYAGQPVDLEDLTNLARSQNLVLIEDAAHALGAKFRGRPVGSVSDLTTFSFHPVKHIATGEGGMVTTHDPDLAEGMRRFREHGMNRDAEGGQRDGAWYYEVVEPGYNYRITDFQCALGISQLAKLDRFLTRRRTLANRYDEALSSLEGLRLPRVRDDVSHAYHIYPVLLELDKLSVDRGDVFQMLTEVKIGVGVHYIPVHLHPYYRDNFSQERGELPTAENAYRRLLTLPLFPAMTEADQDYVIGWLAKILHQVRR